MVGVVDSAFFSVFLPEDSDFVVLAFAGFTVVLSCLLSVFELFTVAGLLTDLPGEVVVDLSVLSFRLPDSLVVTDFSVFVSEDLT